MAVFQAKSGSDWCHLCGTRQDHNVEIWYPANAEHERQDSPHKGASRANGFLRVCADCGETIARVGRSERSRGDYVFAVRNNPALRRRPRRHQSTEATP
jgi:hypothetical protein